MKILMLAENDPAGMGIAFTNAINEHTLHECRLITTKRKYNFDYKEDIHTQNFEITDGEEWDFIDGTKFRNKEYVEELLKGIDIFHFHVLADEHTDFGPFKIKYYIKGKAIVHHHHGHPHFRAYPNHYREKYRKLKRKMLVSTPDLVLNLPSAYWMPNLVPINDPLYMPVPREKLHEEFTIGHSPTKIQLKDTDYLIKKANEYAAWGSRLFGHTKCNVDIIMNTNHKECLKRKQKCHVIFDHLQGYYGVSSLEGLSQGKPVIARLSDWVKTNIKDFTGATILPWHDDIEPYLINETSLEAHNEHSRQFMENCWSDKHVVDRLIEFYNTL